MFCVYGAGVGRGRRLGHLEGLDSFLRPPEINQHLMLHEVGLNELETAENMGEENPFALQVGPTHGALLGESRKGKFW